MKQNSSFRTKQPVFVMGTARSGTSWCANLLATHPNVVAAATAEHPGITGIHESHLLSHTRYCFPERMTCREFVARYQEEDYFKLTGLSPRIFCDHHPGNFTIYELFRAMMDDFADSLGKRYWLEKTPKHTIYYRELARQFPDAYFVVTRRGFRRTVLSNLKTYPRKGVSPVRQLLEKIFRYVSDRRAIRRIKREFADRTVEVSYEKLVDNTQNEIARVLRFLKLEERELHSIFPTNSSSELARGPDRHIAPSGWIGVYVARAVFGLVPFSLVRYLRIRRDKASAHKFPKYTFIPRPKEWYEA